MTMEEPGTAAGRGEAGVRGADRAGAKRMVPVIVTYLEMKAPPRCFITPDWAEPTAIRQADRPTLSYYRYLYDTVGADWHWYERRRLSDEMLTSIIHDDRVLVFVLYVRGVPAGYVELDRRIEGEVEIALFGLVPEYIGRGLGPRLLAWTIEKTWSCYRPRRLWLHTCSLDHPKALAVYQRAGFEVYDREEVQVEEDLLRLSSPSRKSEA